ncbi:hypothetical protein GCK32_000923 [Trichostrongylus colubriformis]|uniref:Uncharacterized protein n=1 Tax=Trichostrongylus colubriformis TaxID=6319 RepID=A0AAN8F4K1_TRICO
MSKRTFIPKWNPYPKPPPIPSKIRGGSRNEEIQSKRAPPAQVRDGGGIRWYGDPSQTKAPPRITHERMTQRVGLFRNAKQSQIVINEISSVVRKASNKQIGRLVAPDKDITCSTSRNKEDPFFDGHYRQHVATLGVESAAADSNVRDHGFVKKKQREEFSHKSRYDYVCESGEDSTSLGKILNSETGARNSRRHGSNLERPHSGTSKWRARVESDDFSDLDEHDLRYEAPRPSSRRTRIDNPVSKIAAIQESSLRTPHRGRAQNEVTRLGDSRNMPSLAGVATRVLSALPPIYLRDDHHEKYDTLAVRLLAESIKQSDTHGSTSNIFRSFLDCTGRIIAEDNSTQPDDYACEDIFQERSEAPPAVPSATPMLEKLFNQTVAEWNADRDNILNSPMSSAMRATDASSMMTPLSMTSSLNQVDAAPFPFEEDQPWDRISPTGDEDNFPFSRGSSPDSRCSDDEAEDASRATFDWTIPPAKSDIFDVIKGN